ncbi:MAG: MgtC/SapB family protein [Patescibacteria group bacterium]|jgi:putative Mg2+ transporter-C (MgtC) family protein
MIKLLLSILFGWILGKERKHHHKSGGSRSLAILCMSACLVSIISLKMGEFYSFDIMRLLQGTIQGMGILGMALIFKNKGEIEGITSASSMFFIIILGFTIGLGLYYYAILSFILAYLILESKYWLK